MVDAFVSAIDVKDLNADWQCRRASFVPWRGRRQISFENATFHRSDVILQGNVVGILPPRRYSRNPRYSPDINRTMSD